jgi:transposase
MSEATATTTLPRPAPTPRGHARQSWSERLRRFADSGLSPAQFCAQEGVTLPSFYAWRRRLQAATPDAEPLGPTLLPVRLAPAAAPLELVLPGGVILRVGSDCDPAALRQLLQLLGVLPC